VLTLHRSFRIILVAFQPIEMQRVLLNVSVHRTTYNPFFFSFLSLTPFPSSASCKFP
jgi:hypothetical protein